MSLNLKAYFVLSAFASFLFSAPAHAAGKDCEGYDSLKNNPVVESGTVTGSDKKTFFVKGETDDTSCPATTGSCLRKAFLVPGNAVLVSRHSGDFACATYVNGKGVETTGWIPNAAVTVETGTGAPKPEDWTGTWIRDEAKITIKAAGPGSLTVHGDATYGIHDPERVKRGSVNLGEISGVAGAVGPRLSFTMGDQDKTLPVDKGDDSMCKVWLQRTGDYLLVDDNNACGGMNVSFRGTYVQH